MSQSRTRQRQNIGLLLGAAIATVVIWQLPFGHLALYPFTILSTWFHEMGHGLTALLLGGQFQQLELFANGSGVATHSGLVWGGRLGQALVAAGGPLGPAVAGSGLILAGQGRQRSRWALMALGGALLLSLIWVRTLFGWIAVMAWSATILAIAYSGSAWLTSFAVPFLGVQACISTYNQLNYLFTRQAVMGGQLILSDSGQMAQYLLLPYWFWGGLLGLLSLGLLLGSLAIAYSPDELEGRR